MKIAVAVLHKCPSSDQLSALPGTCLTLPDGQVLRHGISLIVWNVKLEQFGSLARGAHVDIQEVDDVGVVWAVALDTPKK